MSSRNSIYLILIFIGGVLWSGCGGSLAEKLKNIPTAIGSTNQVTVISDDEIWDGAVGDTFKYLYEGAYPMMPQPEPLFDVRHYSPYQVASESVRQELRTYIYLADLSDTSSLSTKQVIDDLGKEILVRARTDPGFSNKIGRDKWARGQIIFYVLGMGKDQLAKNIDASFPGIAKRIHDFDASQIRAKTYLSGENKVINSLISEKFGIDLNIPADYKKAIEDSTTLWVRRDLADLTSSLLIHTVKYESESQLSKEGVKSLCDEITRKYITTNTPGSYMLINDVDLPMYVYKKDIDQAYTLEARGIWEMKYDYMGGPFFAYLLKDPQRNRLILIDAFVYAPGKEKRDFMQQLEYIVNQLKFTDNI
ncbi:MAG: DUF4837 family protein [Saprospiraceae bacterium]